MKWTGHVACIGERRIACRVLVRKPEGKRPLRTSRLRLKYNIKMDGTCSLYRGEEECM
jgi:hypothetical protein